MFSKTRLAIIVVLILALVACGGPTPPPVPTPSPKPAFHKVADQNTAIPGGKANETFTGFLTDFSYGPSISGGNVAFNAYGQSDRRGIYVSSGGRLKKIADTDTLVPGKNVRFTYFDQASTSGDSVAFVASYGKDQPSPLKPVKDTALFSDFGGKLHIVANDSTPIPGGKGNFISFFGASNANGDIAFTGFGEGGQRGKYVAHSNGKIDEVASSNHPATMLRTAARADDDVVFYAADPKGKKGIYALIGGKLQIIADTNTVIPGGKGAFTDFGVQEGIDKGHIAFIGFGKDDQAGIYYYAGGKLSVIADTHTPLVGGKGNFAHFSSLNGVSVSNDAVVFFGAGENQQGGIYMSRNKKLTPVIKNGDTLDGQKIQVVQPTPAIPDWWNYIPPLTLHSEGLDGDMLAFHVQFPKSSGIYIAKIPGLS